MTRLWLMLGAVAGFLGVALDAFAAHLLQGRLDLQQLKWMETAASYQMMHALALLGVGLLSALLPRARLADLAGAGFTLGLVCFCGGLYLLALAGFGWMSMIVPLGGFGFLIGWAALAGAALTWRRQP